MADISLNENRLGLLIWQTSNVWQSNLRRVIKNYDISLNEYLILETIFKLDKSIKNISQIQITKNTSIDTAVVSSKLTFLENKKLIKRVYSGNNRSKKITLTKNGLNLIEILMENVEKNEKIFFEKLNQETFNLTNSLKLLLGKKIRIRANYNG